MDLKQAKRFQECNVKEKQIFTVFIRFAIAIQKIEKAQCASSYSSPDFHEGIKNI